MEQKQTNTSWYAVHCKGGESFHAAENLANQGFEIFHPTLHLHKKCQGRLQRITEPLSPITCLLRLDQANSDWRPIRSTRGGAKLVSFDLTPAKVPDELIAALQDHTQHADPPLNQHPVIRLGETVSVGTCLHLCRHRSRLQQGAIQPKIAKRGPWGLFTWRRY